MIKCNVAWCSRPVYARGYCHTHWTANRRFNSPFGRHDAQLSIAQDVFNKARQLSTEVLEHANLGIIMCHFCHGALPYHEADCIVKLAENILETTSVENLPHKDI